MLSAVLGDNFVESHLGRVHFHDDVRAAEQDLIKVAVHENDWLISYQIIEKRPALTLGTHRHRNAIREFMETTGSSEEGLDTGTVIIRAGYEQLTLFKKILRVLDVRFCGTMGLPNSSLASPGFLIGLIFFVEKVLTEKVINF